MFTVLDSKTRDLPDIDKITATELWARGASAASQFALLRDGTIILIDDTGRKISCPPNRFHIICGLPQDRFIPGWKLPLTTEPILVCDLKKNRRTWEVWPEVGFLQEDYGHTWAAFLLKGRMSHAR